MLDDYLLASASLMVSAEMYRPMVSRKMTKRLVLYRNEPWHKDARKYYVAPHNPVFADNGNVTVNVLP